MDKRFNGGTLRINGESVRLYRDGTRWGAKVGVHTRLSGDSLESVVAVIVEMFARTPVPAFGWM